MFDFILIFSSLVFLIIASVSDLRFREVSNKLVLFFLIFGITFKVSLAVVTKDFSIILFLVFLFLISVIVFFILWEFGVIAGGDLKLFLVLAVLAPNISLPFNISIYFFTAILFLISLFMLLPWIFINSIYVIFKRKLYVNILKQVFNRQNLIGMLESFLVVLVIVGLVSLFSSINTLWLLLFSFIFSLFLYKIKGKWFYLVIFIISLITLYFLIRTKQLNSFSLSLVLEIVCLILLFSLLKETYKIVKEKVLIEEKKLSKLKEGDLPVYNYYYKNKKLQLVKPTFITKIKMLMSGTYYLNLKIDSSRSCGLIDKDILFLKTMYKNNLISNKIYLKKTLAFVPAVLLSYILIIFI